MDPLREVEHLAELCRRLGAEPKAALVMARQLQRRATQLSEERGQSRETAMTELLQKVIEGREGRFGATPNAPSQ